MRDFVTFASAAALSTMVVMSGGVTGTSAQEATSASPYSCETAMAGSPITGMSMEHLGGMSMAPGTPTTEMNHMAMEIDQMYIDMMIPHHASIIAMAEAALPRLADDRLREIAQTVIATQQTEIDELRGYREAFYGDPDPMPMDEAMMGAMTEMLPGAHGMIEDITILMDAEALVAAFCAAENPDLAFIDLTIPHHQMAIDSSEAVVEQAVHPEIRDVAQRVIEAQHQEIETLTEIRAELVNAATPASS